MPPKAKITKEQITDKAFEILKTEGFAMITARRLSKELNCSTQPIYSIFDDMYALKKELYEKSKVYFEKSVMDIKAVSKPELDFLEIGVAYIKCSKKEQKIFHFICMENNYAMSGVSQLVSGSNILEKQVEIFLNMWLYAHGIACIISNNDVAFNEEEIRKLLINAYKGFSSSNNNER